MESDGLKDRRFEMVRRCVEDMGITDASLLSAMRAVPRHSFADNYFCYMA
jgi:protein-L-isoaspartate O-methyltransferase